MGSCCMRAEIAYRRSFVEECAGLAVVECLPMPEDGTLLHGTGTSWSADRVVPIAPAPPSLAEAVAQYLTRNPSHCPYCHNHGPCVSHPKPPPFAAAYSDTPTGRAYVLVSVGCETCGGKGHVGVAGCRRCNGKGARTDVGEIARRYGGSGDARSARFEVRR